MGVNHHRRGGSGRAIAIVPVKMTSVRLPRKNIAEIGGQPLFHFSVKVARTVREIDEVYVSSEDDEVLRQAAMLGAQCIKRPRELCAANVTNLHVLIHALEEMKTSYGESPEFVVLLQPTHPFRQVSDIERGLEVLRADPEGDSLFSVIRTDELRGRIENGRYIPEFPLPRNKSEEPALFRNTGSFYIFRVERTLAKQQLFGQQIVPLELHRPEFEVDIDEEADLSVARSLFDAYRSEFEAMGLVETRSK